MAEDAAAGRPLSRVLLLQGPVGPFFRRLGRAMAARGVDVHKINLNLADALFYPGPNAVAYRGTPADWPAFLRAYLVEHRIGDVLLFGDCRAYHRAAAAVAEEVGARLWVFEEGYVRPDYITLEPGGVNGFSRFPGYWAAVGDEPAGPEPPPPAALGRTFAWMALFAGLYFLALAASPLLFPHYRHHKDAPWCRELGCWLRAGLRRLRHRRRDHAVLRALVETRTPYFAVPLQVFNDSQISRHSPYADVADFVAEVLRSFAGHAPADHHLVFKHHPMDRGHRCYADPIRRLAGALGCADRVHYVCDAHLPLLFKHARGTVVVNSTVGLSSLYHGTPVYAAGRAIYAAVGLTARGPLDAFWSNPGRVDRALFERVRARLIAYSQINGNFYGALRRCPPFEAIIERLGGVRRPVPERGAARWAVVRAPIPIPPQADLGRSRLGLPSGLGDGAAAPWLARSRFARVLPRWSSSPHGRLGTLPATAATDASTGPESSTGLRVLGTGLRAQRVAKPVSWEAGRR